MSLILGILDSGGAAAGAGGSYESIATVTVGSGGTSEINFTSIPSTYTHLQIRLLGRTTSASTELNVKFNDDANTANYYWHELYGTGSSVGAQSQATGGTRLRTMYWGGLGGGAGIFGVGVMDILDYANTNKNKVLRMLSGWDSNGNGFVHLDSGLWMNTNAITKITLYPTSTTLTEYSSFALYGIKGA
jgi:hypothetical protein